MKRKLLLLAAVLPLFFAASEVFALDFSSDVVISDGRNVMNGKIFVSGDKTRIEMSEMTVISRTDKKVAWLLVPSQKMYMEQPVDTNMVVSDKFPGESERELLGKEKVRGRDAKKYLVTIKTEGSTQQLYQWICTSDGIPLKTASLDGKWFMELHNLQKGSQDERLFELPEGYNKIPAGFMSAD